MSGSNQPNTGSLNILPITQDILPRPQESSKACSINVSWAQVYAGIPIAQYPNLNMMAQINLLQQAQTGQFTTIQAVWIDNSTCPYPVTLVSNETGQQIVVRAFHQGVYPVFANTSPLFTLYLDYQLDINFDFTFGGTFPFTTRLIFLNTPQRYYDAKAEVSTPISYAGTATVTVLNTPVFFDAIVSGSGLRSNTPTLIRIKSLALSLFGSGTFAAIGYGSAAIVMQGSGVQPKAYFGWQAPTGQAGWLLLNAQGIWPDGGMMAMDTPSVTQPFGYSWGIQEGGALPSGGYTAIVNVAADLITIQ